MSIKSLLIKADAVAKAERYDKGEGSAGETIDLTPPAPVDAPILDNTPF